MKNSVSVSFLRFSKTSILVASILIIAMMSASTQVIAKGKPAKPPKGETEYTAVIELQDIDSHFTSPSGQFRWLDIADQVYSEVYRSAYNYTQATVIVAYTPTGASLKGQLSANNLKPNFAYQVKLAGDPVGYPEANENIGFTGRWWREEWNGEEWAGGLNSNDSDYNTNKDTLDSTSPTGLKYKFTGYLVFDYFITDSKGNASLEFEVDSSYHVLWKTTQTGHTRQPEDGPIKTSKFKVNSKASPAYDADFDWVTVGVYGQVQRTPVGGKYPPAGLYHCQFFLTEESFHGSGGNGAGNWAAAMGASIEFHIS